MNVKINFDSVGSPETPTFILANRSGNKLGKINAVNIIANDSLNNAAEISFVVNKFINNKKDYLWNKIKDFKLIYCKEFDTWYEISVEIDESDKTVKNVSCVQLAQAELSQILLHNIEINTELDISREEYTEPTVLYNSENHSASLIHRITEKAEHYTIAYVDESIKNIQKTFVFDNISIYDAFIEISEEIDCLFVFDSGSDKNGNIKREISIYDLESNCLDCGHRGKFTEKCPNCDSNNITEGYGEDTTIFITSDELGENIKLKTDTNSVKNCFKLEAGDDLMTATIRNCNPNGTDYLWYISDDMKEDMSDNLVSKLEEYDILYNFCQNERSIDFKLLYQNLYSDYNNLVNKYKTFKSDLQNIDLTLVGYANLMNCYYSVIDFELYIKSALMPSAEISETNANTESQKLNSQAISPVSVSNIENISQSSANNAVLSMAKCLINSNYKIEIKESVLNGNNEWAGSFVITNYSDEEDTAESEKISVIIDDNYENFVYQKIQKSIDKSKSDKVDIIGLFKLNQEEFETELQKYNLDSLNAFWNICQSCVDILIEQGIADKDSWNGNSPNLYDDLYLLYYNKLQMIEAELKLRQKELDVISIFKNTLERHRNWIQMDLDFEKFLGNDLMNEFQSYRREFKYVNSNYISDGLNNAELFEKAREFIATAEKELYTSAELQHSITADLYNLLVIKKFESIVKYFKVGNWIRILIDDKIYKLRLLSFEINYDDLKNISVEFSDVLKISDGISDQQSVIKQAVSMTTSYNYVQRQASQGASGNKKVDDWVNQGLSLTTMKIVNSAENQNITFDEHGILCREYDNILDTYTNEQTKIINRGIYITDDNWLTSKAAIGNFIYYNPETERNEEGYGVIADTLVGNLILSEKVGIYNETGSINLGETGITITTDSTEENSNTMNFMIQKKVLDSNGNENFIPMFYVDSNGELILNGSVKLSTTTGSNMQSLNDITNPDKVSENASNSITEQQIQVVSDSTIEKYRDMLNESMRIINSYKSDIGQFMTFGDNGLTLGATSNDFKINIDNKTLRFFDSDSVVAYISNNQLYINNATIKNSLLLGKFFFSPREDGGVSLTWQG
ncbi:MAG: hypothetical protein NC548_37975 [Lachnospiraceae bacterium]|nr:hypothetical protein [Lachnospiraceae bacterium]